MLNLRHQVLQDRLAPLDRAVEEGAAVSDRAEHGNQFDAAGILGWEVEVLALVCFSTVALLVACSSDAGVAHQSKARLAAPVLTADP